MEDHLVIDACRDFSGKFEARFGSLLCRVLRPEGFGSENPPHLCEEITCDAIYRRPSPLGRYDWPTASTDKRLLIQMEKERVTPLKRG